METSQEENRVPRRVSLPYKPSKREIERQEETERRWKEVQKDPRSTVEMLDIIRRRFEKKPPPNTTQKH